MIVELIAYLTAFLGLGYAAILSMVYWSGSKPLNIRKDENYTPSVSVVIPTFNEEKIIEKRILNLVEMDYPKDKLEVIFVDNSSDSTPEIVKHYQKDNPWINLLKQQKHGFNNALNEGYEAARGQIVVKSDCDAFPQRDALRKAVSNFADRRVGAVSGVHLILSKTSNSLEKEFRSLQYKVQKMEAHFHSSLISHGAFGAYRKELIPTLSEEITADDSETVINVVRSGYRAIIDPSVKSLEWYPETFKERRKQRGRRASGVMRVLLKNIDMFFNPRYGAFGFVSLPTYFFILILTPVLILALLLLIFCYSLLYQPVLLTPFLGVFIFLAVPSKTSTRVRAVLDTYLGCTLALFKIFTKKKTWSRSIQGRKELSEAIANH